MPRCIREVAGPLSEPIPSRVFLIQIKKPGVPGSVGGARGCVRAAHLSDSAGFGKASALARLEKPAWNSSALVV